MLRDGVYNAPGVNVGGQDSLGYNQADIADLRTAGAI